MPGSGSSRRLAGSNRQLLGESARGSSDHGVGRCSTSTPSPTPPTVTSSNTEIGAGALGCLFLWPGAAVEALPLAGSDRPHRCAGGRAQESGEIHRVQDQERARRAGPNPELTPDHRAHQHQAIPAWQCRPPWSQEFASGHNELGKTWSSCNFCLRGIPSSQDTSSVMCPLSCQMGNPDLVRWPQYFNTQRYSRNGA